VGAGDDDRVGVLEEELAEDLGKAHVRAVAGEQGLGLLVLGAEHVADDDEDGPMDLSDWNVPSWTELIAGLYRPPDR